MGYFDYFFIDLLCTKFKIIGKPVSLSGYFNTLLDWKLIPSVNNKNVLFITLPIFYLFYDLLLWDASTMRNILSRTLIFYFNFNYFNLKKRKELCIILPICFCFFFFLNIQGSGKTLLVIPYCKLRSQNIKNM